MNKSFGVVLDKKCFIIKFLLVVSILIIGTWHIKYMTQIRVINDEFGYWGTAAYLAGYKWSSLLKDIPYYSYGYSALLVPLFFLIGNPILMYKVAILINVILLSASFLLTIECGKRIFKNGNEIVLIFISYLVTIYSGNIIQTQIAWTETLIYFLFWLLLFMILKVELKPNMFSIVLISIITPYMYAVHQRNVGIIVSVAIVLYIMKVQDKIQWKHLICFLVICAICFGVHSIFKYILKDNLWGDSLIVASNDYAGRVGKLNTIFSKEGIIALIEGTVGKIYYIMAATFFVGGWGILAIVKKVICFCEESVTNRKISWNKIQIPYLFILCSFVSTFVISVLTSYTLDYTGRLDNIIYGRYFEFLLGPIALIGFIELYRGRGELKTYVFQIFIFLIAALFVNRVFVNYDGEFNAYGCPGLYYFISRYLNKNNIAFYITIISLLWSFVVFVGGRYKKNKLWKILLLLELTILVVNNLKNANLMIDNVVVSGQNAVYDKIHGIYDHIKTININKNIYYVQEDPVMEDESTYQDYQDKNIKYLQYLLYDYKIKRLNYSDILQGNYNDESYFIILKSSNIYPDILQRFTVIKETEVFSLMIAPESSLENVFDKTY